MATRLLIDHRTAPELRHPEKANRPDNPIQRKPDWIRVKAPNHPSTTRPGNSCARTGW